jgi:glycosyltransferase involved in cell wall biosynthesis
MEVALIITTYNWPSALELNLRSVVAQTRVPDEILIADDGSDAETGRIVKKVLSSGNVPWCHVRHSDQGVRQSRIKNLAVRHSRSDYLIFVDHDVVLHPHFVHDHLSMAQNGFFLQGKRVLLPRAETERVINQGIFHVPGPWMKGLANRKNALRLPWFGRCLSRPKRFERTLRGCNLSLFREDFLRVDGFDEVFDGSWGREDSDFCYRLFHAGVQVKSLWFMAIQYHLFHGATAKWDKERLDAEINRNLREERKTALKGYGSLSPEGEIVSTSRGLAAKC